MLGTRFLQNAPCRSQRGVVLLITLVVLVAMTLTAIALMRSMDTTNLIAGNLAFQQSATRSADAGVESAIAWLEANNGSVQLQNNQYTLGYSALVSNPAVGQTWDNFFTHDMSGRTLTLAADAMGNVVTYTIERLCTATGAWNDTSNHCTVTPGVSGQAQSSQDVGNVSLTASQQIYYRITSRTSGPHNVKSYVQVIVAM